MKAVYCQKGETIDYKNDKEEIIEAGDVVNIISRIGIAGTSIKENEIGTVHVVGVFEFRKAQKEKIIVGTKVYYDEANDCITATETSNIPAGYAVKTASENDVSVYVKLIG
ncbi:DUF2190 family protein [Clostridium ihumii]|uniref:DUF2190 family protein n=1 Tax=Clostridium ihumii TaxID=1470356 RepID=UPI00068517E6|nr:DUF2190 family protein [Clostridium ihumii]